MDRQQEALDLAKNLLGDIELKRLKASEIALKSNRLARLVGHEDLLAFLALERAGYPTDGSADEWLTRADRWGPDEGGRRTFYTVPLTKIEALAEGQQKAVDALKGGGNYSGEWASIAGREHDQKITRAASNAADMSAICGAVVATIYEMVVEIYHELLFSELQASLFEETQARVDGALATASGSALEKIERVSDRLRDGDPESVSQALTTCRRLIDSCADHLFPARDSSYDAGDGLVLRVGRQNVLNRLQAYCHEQGIPKSRRDRLRRALADLYDRCSAGTHSQVDISEARFIFLQTYIVLGEVLTLARE